MTGNPDHTQMAKLVLTVSCTREALFVPPPPPVLRAEIAGFTCRYLYVEREEGNGIKAGDKPMCVCLNMVFIVPVDLFGPTQIHIIRMKPIMSAWRS